MKPHRIPEGEEPTISIPRIEVDHEGEPVWKVEKIVTVWATYNKYNYRLYKIIVQILWFISLQASISLIAVKVARSMQIRIRSWSCSYI